MSLQGSEGGYYCLENGHFNNSFWDNLKLGRLLKAGLSLIYNFQLEDVYSTMTPEHLNHIYIK